MIVASSATATAVPTPSSWMNEIPEVANVPIATQNRSAAAVTTRPVRSSPSATASRFSSPRSRASLIREKRKIA